MESMTYNLKEVRDLLLYFTEEELKDFCFYEPAFRHEPYESLPRGKRQAIREILDFAHRRGIIDIILEWAERANPVRYKERGPYYDSPRRQVVMPSSNMKGQSQISQTETVPAKFKYDVFVSHASEDKPIIEQIIQDFKRAGVTYWVDHEQIGFGDRITERIEEGLRESKYVLVCLSANLGQSNWVKAEYGPILNRELSRSSRKSERKVIPLKLDDSSNDEIPLLLYDKRRANYSNVTEFNQLLEFLKQRPKFPVSYSEEAAALFDVFLAHNSEDKPLVESIAEKLKLRGLNPWLDKEQIPPGRWFQDVIQQAIPTVKSAAIFIGPKGLGKWQRVELRTFISQCVEADLPVIPVLLPGVSDIPEDLRFLKELNWVRFSSGIDDSEALDNLEWGITGKHPRKS